MENFNSILIKWHLNQNSVTQSIVNNLFNNNHIYPSNRYNKIRKLSKHLLTPILPEDKVVCKRLSYAEKLEYIVFILSTLFITLVIFLLYNV